MTHNFDQVFNRLNTYCTQWDYIEDRFSSKDVLPFSISDTDFAVPDAILDTLQKRLAHPIFGYTRWNHSDFLTAICHHYQTRFSSGVNPSWIAYSPSVMYSVSILLQILTNPQDTICVFNPMYDAFFHVIEKNNRQLLSCSLDSKNNFAIDFTELENCLKYAQVFLLCSPHNPTGRVFSESELEAIVALCKKYDVWILCDEIHGDITLFGHSFISLLSKYQKYSKMIVVNSASKTFNTPGLGASYAIIPSPTIYEKFMEQTRQKDFVNSANIMGMQALITGYQQCDEYIDALTRYIEKNMQYIESFMKENIPQLTFTLPQATYLAWIDVSALDVQGKELQEILVKVGKVAIMDGATYGENGKGYLRMNVGCPLSKLQKGMQGLQKAIVAIEHTI